MGVIAQLPSEKENRIDEALKSPNVSDEIIKEREHYNFELKEGRASIFNFLIEEGMKDTDKAIGIRKSVAYEILSDMQEVDSDKNSLKKKFIPKQYINFVEKEGDSFTFEIFDENKREEWLNKLSKKHIFKDFIERKYTQSMTMLDLHYGGAAFTAIAHYLMDHSLVVWNIDTPHSGAGIKDDKDPVLVKNNGGTSMIVPETDRIFHVFKEKDKPHFEMLIPITQKVYNKIKTKRFRNLTLKQLI